MKRHLTRASLDFVHRTKSKIRRMMDARQLTQSQLSRVTGIPSSNISRWLSQNHDDFMGLAEAHVVSEAMGVSVQAILAESDRGSLDDDEHAVLLEQAAALPTTHLASMLGCYAEILGVRVG